jgi:hypothetical protein
MLKNSILILYQNQLKERAGGINRSSPTADHRKNARADGSFDKQGHLD